MIKKIKKIKSRKTKPRKRFFSKRMILVGILAFALILGGLAAVKVKSYMAEQRLKVWRAEGFSSFSG
ncbi:hypothetical protein A2160_01725 [Candidatus Beckwithbacteria bacterium RBG_13_42_9]|uniref:Uncharacterized protein n=1 Tax=Candidatus Beckwithbacteria bacterium RBG_13_42_9 TaxID=1797457 RepID=A0A1F5E3Y9_9BACT|nr:MAG: hypothetical protein A2160_01725 [Candidatus Beckwithbacteria bacterium RBG_13_42_9]